MLIIWFILFFAPALIAQEAGRRPNIIYILADDLGYGDLGSYGQKKIRTPNLDRLASEGIRFTQHYSGSSVCAPSRCALLTGKHTGHTYIRDNGELPTEGQRPIPRDTITIGRMLQERGYRTAVIGKWGLGGPGSTGEPNQQGFHHWFGYLCQRQAHNFYPTHLWRNGSKVMLQGNEGGTQLVGEHYSHDLLAAEALEFIRNHKDRPFFLYLPFTIPHLAIQVPEDSLAQYAGQFEDPPYDGSRRYLPHPAPRAGYAAMISRMDRDIGRIMSLIAELGIENHTLVFFSSDNGPVFNIGGADSHFFHSAGPLRGLKQDLYEGGIRVPMIARWKGKIQPGSTTDLVSAFWDVLPTLGEITGAPLPEDIDGISFLPTLLGKPGQKLHRYLYWEYHSQGGRQAVRMGDWKGVRYNVKADPNGPIELYNLNSDIGETRNLADQHPEIIRQMAHIMAARTRSDNPAWNF